MTVGEVTRSVKKVVQDGYGFASDEKVPNLT